MLGEINGRERSAMPFLAKFRRKGGDNVKFVAISRKRLSNSWHFYSDQHGEAQDPCLLLLDSTLAGQGIFKVPVQDCREKR